MAAPSHKRDRQPNETILASVGQLQLSLPGYVRKRERQQIPYSIAEIKVLPHEGAAIDLCMRCGGYQQDELAADLGVDKGTFSKVLSGDAQLKWPKLCLLMDLCENEIPLIYRVETRQYNFTTLKKHATDLELELERVRAELAEVKRERAVEVKLMRELQR